YQKRGAPEQATAAQNYGYALTLIRVGRPDEAAKLLDQLVTAHPDQHHYTLALARAQADAGHISTSLEILKSALDAFPKSPAVKLSYAQILLTSGDTDRARAYLTNHPNLTHGSPKA